MFKTCVLLGAVLLLTAAAASADIPAVVNIRVNGQNYELTELIEHKKPLFNRQPEYWKYECLDSNYPLVIHRKEYKVNEQLLRYVPDKRDFYTRHPWVQKFMVLTNAASIALEIIELVRI
jgi:hypothetical protein